MSPGPAAYSTASGGSSSGMVAAVQYSGTAKLVYLGFPFETISDETARTQLMAAAIDFFELEASDPQPIFADGFESGNTSAWTAAVP